MKTLVEYAQAVLDHKDDPHTLAELHVEMAVKAAYLSERYKPIKLAKAAFWQQKYASEKPLSETYLETQWDVTKEGEEEIRLKIELDGLDRLIAACKSVAIEAAREAKNLS